MGCKEQSNKEHTNRCGTYLVVAAVACALVLVVVDPALAQEAGYNDSKWREICGKALSYVEEGFGTLLATAAGIGAIVASAAGGFRMAWALIVVSIGSFILRNYVDLFYSGLCQ